jgi:hypothetical protein
VLSRDALDSFRRRLTTWCIEHLGCGHVGSPVLSLYVNGCRQGTHNDAENGRWAYVFSLTVPQRRFVGGSTHIYRPEPYWDTPRAARALSGSGVYDAVAPEFNRLVVFDDRLLHAVEPVEGTLDPVQGRVVLQGHIREGGAWVDGALSGDQVSAVVASLEERTAALRAGHRGLVTVRLKVRPDGAVASADVLSDLAAPREPGSAVTAAESIRGAALDLAFPRSPGESVVTVPVVLDQRSAPSNASGT